MFVVVYVWTEIYGDRCEGGFVEECGLGFWVACERLPKKRKRARARPLTATMRMRG